jgi:hypothetical protein
VTMETLEANPAAAVLLPADAALPQLPEVLLDAGLAQRLRQGQAVRHQTATALDGTLVRLYAPHRQFLGIGRQEPAGEDAALVHPVRLFNDLGQNQT